MKRTSRFATAFNVALGCALLTAATSAFAQNAVRGKQLYEAKLNPSYFSCGDMANGCHGPTPSPAVKNINKGTNPTVILNAINGGVPLMGPLKGYVSNIDAADIAAYIANPAAANAPAITASGTTLTFGTTQVGATSSAATPASLTLTNTGAGTLTITGITKSGTNAADFTATGSCVGASVSVAPGATCTLSATFTPTATGTRTATLTVASNAATNPAITLSGTGSAVPVAAVTLNKGALTFATQTVSTTSAAQTVTLTSTGNAAVSVTQVSATPTPEFAATSNCVGTVAAGASCTINVTFTPAAAGTRSGTLTITSNATTSPNTITLSGTSVLQASPIATVQSNTVAFPMTTVGVMSSGLSTTFTNTGNAALQISAVTIGGANAGDFRLGAANTCAAGTLAAGASCALEVAFQPTSAGTKSATVTIAHNATGGSTVVNVSGTAATATTTTTSAPTGSSPGTSSPTTTSSALAPSNVGGGGALSLVQLAALALSLLFVPALRRRLARR